MGLRSGCRRAIVYYPAVRLIVMTVFVMTRIRMIGGTLVAWWVRLADGLVVLSIGLGHED